MSSRLGIPPLSIKKDARVKELEPLKDPVVRGGAEGFVPPPIADTQDFTATRLEVPKNVDRDSRPIIQALRQQIDAMLDLAAAQRVLQVARQRLMAKGDWTAVDSAHEAIARAPMPTTARHLVEVLLDRLAIGGSERETVFKAVDLVLAGSAWPSATRDASGASNPSHGFSTQMAVTDEGYDHVMMTLADPRMLNKAWAHVERTHPGQPDPYALPPEQLVGLIRLLQGADAPSTIFYGSPSDHPDAAQAVRELQWVARYAFDRGVSEVTVSMDGLSEPEAIGFMRKVAGPLNLDRDSQRLSAAFHLSNGGLAPTPRDQDRLLEGALKAISITAQGGFGKVSLDSASRTLPSYPLIEYFGVANLVEWTHRAHQAGLETYVSGGMQAYHFPLLAMTGVDGVGVGESIHEASRSPGLGGRLAPKRVHEALARRDSTEASAPGQLVYLLRRLDHKQGKGLPLSDLERRLQSSAHQWVTRFANKVDLGVNELRQRRDRTLAQLQQGKLAGTVSEDDFSKKGQAALEQFGQSLETLVAQALSEPGLVAECQTLTEQGARSGYPLRPATSPVGGEE